MTRTAQKQRCYLKKEKNSLKSTDLEFCSDMRVEKGAWETGKKKNILPAIPAASLQTT